MTITFTLQKIPYYYYSDNKKKFEICFNVNKYGIELIGKFNLITIKENNETLIIEENTSNKYTFDDFCKGTPMEFMSTQTPYICECNTNCKMWYLVQLTDDNMFKYCIQSEESLVSGINISIPMTDNEKKEFIEMIEIIKNYLD